MHLLLQNQLLVEGYSKLFIFLSSFWAFYTLKRKKKKLFHLPQGQSHVKIYPAEVRVNPTSELFTTTVRICAYELMNDSFVKFNY